MDQVFFFTHLSWCLHETRIAIRMNDTLIYAGSPIPWHFTALVWIIDMHFKCLICISLNACLFSFVVCNKLQTFQESGLTISPVSYLGI